MLCCKQAICVALVVFAQIASAQMPSRPNILLLMAEDMSARVGAFDDSVAITPKLSSTGVAVVTGGVVSAFEVLIDSDVNS